MPITTLENPLVKNLGPVAFRHAQQQGGRELPQGIRIISADSHYEIGEDIFSKYFPEHLKHKAPSFTFDEFPTVGGAELRNKTVDPRIVEEIRKYRINNMNPGIWDMNVRDQHLDAEGVEKEILFPNTLLTFIRDPDPEVQENVYSAYNRHLADLTARHHPGRYYGIGVCRNWWDPAAARSAIQEIVDLGLPSFMIPTSNPGKTPGGAPISYVDEAMDVFWAEAAAAGLPVCFHVGENVQFGQRGSLAATFLEAFSPFRKPFGQLAFGGVFDRHPNLQIVFAEAGIAWVPPMLQDAEMILDMHYTSLDYIPQRRPTEYWRDQCFATFMNDPLGLSLLEYIGIDNVMWSSDDPHNEGTLGMTWDSVFAVINTVGIDAAQKILGGTAIKLFGLDR